MTDRFRDALAFSLSDHIEGGYVNHPKDKGGATNMGVTQRTYTAWATKHGEPLIDVKDLTRPVAERIYREEFWDPSGAESLAWPLALCHFDAFINHRPTVARRFLANCNGRWETYLVLREKFYERLIVKDPSQAVFRKGWMNRVALLRKACQ